MTTASQAFRGALAAAAKAARDAGVPAATIAADLRALAELHDDLADAQARQS